MKKIGVTLAAALLLGSEAMATCADFYVAAVQNLNIEATQDTNRAALFNLHCQKDGSTKSSDTSLGLDAITKIVDIGINLSSRTASERHKEFCRIGSERRFSEAATLSVNRYAAEGAFANFNQCKQIESKGLIITHKVAWPDRFIVEGTFGTGAPLATVDAVSFDDKQLSCSYVRNGDPSTKIDLSAKSAFDPDGKNFSVSCVREPELHEGQQVFPHSTFQLSTQFGSYSVVLPSDKYSGFDLASEAKAAFGELSQQLSAAQTENASIEDKLTHANRKLTSLGLVKVYQGDNPASFPGFHHIRCENQGGQKISADDFVAACNPSGKRPIGWEGVWFLPGGACGHTMWTSICAAP